MKKLTALALMISLMLLQGCDSQNAWETKLEEKRQELSQAQTLTFTADTVSNLGTQEFSCKITCLADDSGVTVQVIEPEIIQGVTAHISKDSVISYEGVQLYVGDLTSSGITPVTALATVVEAISGGFTQEIWEEQYGVTQFVVMNFYEAEDTDVKIWFLADGLIPARAEIICDSEAVFSCEITDFLIA